MIQRQTEDISAQESAIKKICEGLRDFRACGYDWPAVSRRVMYWLGALEGDEADEEKRRTVADAAEKSYRQEIARRKLVKRRLQKPK